MQEVPSFTLEDVIIYLPINALIVFTVFSMASSLRKRGWKVNYTRKFIHISLFLIGWFISTFVNFTALWIYGAVIAPFGILIVLLDGGNSFYEAVARPSDSPHRTLYLIIPYISSVSAAALVNIFLGDLLPMSILAAGLGDAVGEPIGARYGRHKFKVPSITGIDVERSLEGSASIFIAISTITSLYLIFEGYILFHVIPISFICGFVATIVEAFSPHGVDNFTIQVSVALTAGYLLSTLHIW
ncbi:MAG: hypothetical protein ACTSYT_03775 [Candidatus Asgardarchaeia archaeon]